jgi:hypothetical protein
MSALKHRPDLQRSGFLQFIDQLISQANQVITFAEQALTLLEHDLASVLPE